ncbi:MAG TPA: sigma-70 family RNA polymerase sigma factor [Ilumatobacter sp.]|nr:sigma-70 family RNA polymerase sigma factor [Ilumatobacter sp.]
MSQPAEQTKTIRTTRNATSDSQPGSSGVSSASPNFLGCSRITIGRSCVDVGMRTDEMGLHPDRVIDAEFRALYEREHAGQVRRAALLLRSTEQAHDVVHDAMVELYSRWETIDQPGAYLSKVVLNRCRDATRRARVHRRSLVHLVGRAASPPPEDPLGDLFDRLPFNQRAVVILRFYEGYSVAETAAAMGCPQGSVGPWMDRAMATMREQLS